MGNRSITNRPMKFGGNDRREFIVQDSEVALRALNNSNGDPIFLGRAKVGVAASEAKWQIRKITYDGSGVILVEWPQNDQSNPSGDYEFVWSSVGALTVNGITQANPGVVTVASIGSLQNGDQVIFQNVGGMTEVNFTGTNIYTVANIVGATFELSGIDTTGFGAYTSGGTVDYGEYLNYTYA